MKRIKNDKILALILLLSASMPLFGQQEENRIMAYNLLEYWNTSVQGDSAFRDPYFSKIINATQPDIIAACEIQSESKANTFLNDVLNNSNNLYKMGTFIANNDPTDVNVVYYKPSKFTFLLSQLIISSPSDTANHPTYLYQFYNNLTGNKIYIFGVHFNSGSSGDNIRNFNASAVRIYTAAFPAGSYFIAAGDFNLFKGGNEPAFSTLLNQSSTGYFIDPLNGLIGDPWTSSDYFPVHTLATRLTKFGGSNENYGLKYRSDLILNSQSVMNSGGITYINGSYKTYGNDGLHHLKAINGSPVIPQGQTIADALYYASDHLPVYADYLFTYPNPLNPPYPGSIAFTQVGVDDDGGGNHSDVIEFVTLYRMNLTTLKVTNNRVLSDYTLSDEGGTFDLANTPWTDVPAGTFVRLGSNLINDNDASDRILKYNGSGSGTLPVFTNENQLIAYTGTAPSPAYFIAGIHWGNTTGWSTESYAPGTPSDIQLTGSNAKNWYYSSVIDGNLYDTRNSVVSPINWSSSASWIDYNNKSIGISLLPVELNSFIASYSSNKVNLYWQTKTEVMNYGFDIERSVNNSEWIKITFVSGYGSSNVPHDYSYEDTDTGIPGIYKYRLKQIDTDGKFKYSPVVETEVFGPDQYSLSENYPNPFNPSTTIEYQVPVDGKITLRIMDVLGREVETLVDGEVTAGKHRVVFDGSSLSSGIYVYQLIANNKLFTKKMMLLK
ncbi:MAG TPA: T9SS type A sorting domain-containing protein [Ignavibacteriaceae bacterium]